MLIVLDNLDSFTYNLVQMFRQQSDEVRVFRNNEISVRELLAQKPGAIVLSPGPGRPEQAGVMPELIKAAVRLDIPLLGICLGHQAIAEAFGGQVVPARRIMHGKRSEIRHAGSGILCGVPNPFKAVRYHSLSVAEAGLPEEVEITCRSEDGEIMGIRHWNCVAEGVQFQPESILSEYGSLMVKNFCDMTGA